VHGVSPTIPLCFNGLNRGYKVCRLRVRWVMSNVTSACYTLFLLINSRFHAGGGFMQSEFQAPDELDKLDRLLMEDERAELEVVLASSLFVRNPSLANLLSYLCQKYFQGEADLLKEYTIGVEAFGRAPDFDKKEDSIVRVEIRRLREKLRQYYET